MKKKSDNKIKNVVSSRWFLVIALVVAVFFVFIFARAYYQDYKVRQEIKSLKDEVKKLEMKKLESMEILKYVTSDDFVEEKARLELNMQEPGEKVIIFDNVGSTVQETITQLQTEAVVLSNPIKWWYYFIHKDYNN